MVNLNEINVVKHENQHILVDTNMTRPIFVSSRVYDIVTRLKQGQDYNLVEDEYGRETVDMVLNHIQSLIEKKVIKPSDGTFYEKGMREIKKYEEGSVDVLEGMIMVSQDCNLACKYCYGGESGTFNHKGLMEIETAERCFRYLLSVGKGREFQKVVFIGGEPLLNMKVIKHIVLLWEKIKASYGDKKVFFTLTTNGLLLTPEIVEFFKKYGVGVAVSLDGPKQVHDQNRVLAGGGSTFDKVMQGIELLRKYDLPISIRTTVTKDVSFAVLHDFFEQQRFDIHTISIVDYPMVKPERCYQFAIEDYRKFLLQQREIMKKGYKDIAENNKNSFDAKHFSVSFHKSRREYGFFLCGAGNWIVAFGIDGYIYPCNRLVGHEKFRIGDLKNGINKENMKKIFSDFLEASKNCNTCWAAARCKGRCFYERINEQDEMKEVPRELCEIYQETLAESLIFSHQMQKEMKENQTKLKEAIVRYDANHMMKEYLG